jgi:hypothetical protein
MGATARLGLLSPEPARVSLRFVAQAFAKPRRLRITAGDVSIGDLLIEPGRGGYRTPPFDVGSGPTFIVLTSLDGADSPGSDPRQLSVAFYNLALAGE